MNDFIKNHIISSDMENIFNRKIPYTELYGKTVLVTGASGMLASYLVFFFIWLNEKQGAGIRILALVRDRDRLRARFGRYCDREYFICIIADVCDFKETEEDIDYIVHAASPAMPTAYKKIPVEVASPNVIGLYNLLRIAVSKNVKGFLFFSSGDIYGKMPEGTGTFSEKNIGTMDPLDIHSCYGESKRMGETFIKCFAVEYGLDACSVRIGHTYAPTMDLENDPRVFASFMKCAVERKDIIMLSDGSAKRPFCYIADAVAAFIILLIKGEKGEAYNMTNTEMLKSISELADIICSLEVEQHLKVLRKYRSKNDGYLENTLNQANCPVSDKLKKLGWNCEYDIKRGFGQVLEFFREEGY